MSDEWPVCGRYVHLSGGILAINEPDSNVVTFWPSTTCKKVCEIKIPTFKGLYTSLQKIGFNIIGVEFITHESEASGEAPTQWRTYSKQTDIWSNWKASQLWSQLASSGYNHKNGLLYDLSNRISYQLESINQRIKDLSLAYRVQLNGVNIKSNPKPGGRFQDGHTDIPYQRFQAFLFDVCILRDYLAEFYYNFASHGKLKKSKIEVTTAGGLLKILRKETMLEPLSEQLISIMSNNGWLRELGAYRDLVMHSAPINIVNHRLYCIQESMDLPDSKSLQSVRFPIPSNPDGLYKQRSKRDDFDKYIHEMEVMAKAAVEEYGEYDCLEYAQQILTNISNLSMSISKLSPFKPMMKQLIKTKLGTASRFVYV